MRASSRVIYGLLMILAVCGCEPGRADGGLRRQRPHQFGAFANPERVTIVGYSGDAMEPFITRDGRYLLFNNSNDPSVNTDLQYAERDDDVTFTYRGPIRGVATVALEGVPSMDASNTLYFVSTRSYDETLSTIYRGTFADGDVSAVALVPGISKQKPGFVNFDAEISADGQTLYFVDSHFTPAGVPEAADIAVAKRTGSGFKRLRSSRRLLKRINTDALEYAPSISADGLELFFTRLEGTVEAPDTSIYRAVRTSTGEPFGAPEKVSAIVGFVEGPTLSPDGRSLYYHKREGSQFAIYRVTRSR